MTKQKVRSLKRVVATAAILGVIGTGYTGYQWHKAEADAIMTQEQLQIELNQENSKLTKQLEAADAEIARLNAENAELQKANKELKEKCSREVIGGYSDAKGIEVEVTAYTLSESDCDKGRSHPDYGITANGTNLAGQTLESARAIAVDPRVIPLGSKVRLVFKDAEMQKYNGIYTAVDTGGAIKGNIIDLFAGEGADSLAMHIGRRAARAEVL